MKILGFMLFFSPDFKTSYTTTIGDTIYYPSQSFVNLHPVSTLVILLHELVHVYDEKRLTKPLFSASYLLPQLLAFLIIPLLFISWKIALPFLIFLAPFPAYFRKLYEKRAYLASLYVMYQLNIKSSFNIDIENQSQFFANQFKTSAYYWMWPFKSINSEFEAAVQLIKSGKRPYEDKVFDILDQIIAVS